MSVGGSLSVHVGVALGSAVAVRPVRTAGKITSAATEMDAALGSLSGVALGFGFVELAAGPPSHWIVTLVGGSQVEVWADAVTGLTEKTAQDEHIVFGVLIDIDVDLQSQFEVTARTPARNRRVEVAVARFPRGCVQDVITAA